MRICSFLPSGTEIVYALGLSDSLYGVSEACDFPTDAQSKPRVVRCRFDAEGMTSAEIDGLISQMYGRGERVYEIDEDVLRAAAPDLVITQELCDVCAVSYEDVRHAVSRLPLPPQVISLDPTSVGDVLDDVRLVGDLCGAPDAAFTLISELQARLDVVRQLAGRVQRKPKVACVEWLDPLIVAGHWVPQMVRMAGGVDALAEPGAASRRVDMAELAACDADVLLLMPCGMGVERAIEEAALLRNADEWRDLRAVQDGNLYVVDAGAYFSRSGPRLVDGLEMLGQIIHPDVFEGDLDASAAVRLQAWP